VVSYDSPDYGTSLPQRCLRIFGLALVLVVSRTDGGLRVPATSSRATCWSRRHRAILPGMTRNQVRYLLGPPIAATFTPTAGTTCITAAGRNRKTTQR
jgi:hypothetical protein